MRMLICPQRHLASAFSLSGPADLLSLVSPDALEPHSPLDGAHRLVLRFNDIDAPQPGLLAPDRNAVAALLAFGRAASTLVIHCHAGISRSTAAAYVLACQAGELGDEAALANDLRRLSPAATPNPLVVALADRLLGREGRMTAAIRSIGRGADAFEGPLVDWRLGG